jgi:DNA-binding CsgD family transcriptional regulator
MGHSNEFIGYLLGISPSTVGRHLASGMRKLNAGSRGQLVAELAATRKKGSGGAR